MPDAGYLTIGKVVKKLQPQYPDLSVSKVRYLEEEGLLNPSRTPGGYRLYSQLDVRRLETILYLQKNKFMPLQVIKDELAKGEVSLLAHEDDHTSASPKMTARTAEEYNISEEDIEKFHALTRMPEMLGVSVSFVRQLSEAGVIHLRISPAGRDLVDGRDLTIIKTCDELNRFGITPNNLRQYVRAANRESGMFDSALTVYGTNASGGGSEPTDEQRKRYEQALSRMIDLTNNLRETLIRRSLRGSNGARPS